MSSEKFRISKYLRKIKRRWIIKLTIESVTNILSVLFLNSSEKNLLNTIIYSTDIRSIKSTYTNGEKKVNDIEKKEDIIANYNYAIKNIKN